MTFSTIDRLNKPYLSRSKTDGQPDVRAYRNLPTKIPQDPQHFYHELGLLMHPRTGQPVPELTSYQYNVWRDGFRYKYRIVVKSQKVGLSTSALMEDFHHAITDCTGYEILVIGQSQEKANEHLRDLKYLIAASNKYRDYLLHSAEFVFREEKTKVSQVYIKNPYDPYRPTRIIGLGASEGAAWSWKRVKHVHMSDVAAIAAKDDSGLFGAVFSRLANSDGSILIESPPRGQCGTFYKIFRESKLRQLLPEAPPPVPADLDFKMALSADDVYKYAPKPESMEAQFKTYEIPADYAVQAGLIRQEFLDAERVRMGRLYPQFYECEFLATGNAWYDEELIRHEDYDITA